MSAEEIGLLTLALTAAVAVAKTGEKLVTWFIKQRFPKAEEATASTSILKLSPEIEAKISELYFILSQRNDDQIPRIYAPDISRRLDRYHEDVMRILDNERPTRPTWS